MDKFADDNPHGCEVLKANTDSARSDSQRETEPLLDGKKKKPSLTRKETYTFSAEEGLKVDKPLFAQDADDEDEDVEEGRKEGRLTTALASMGLLASSEGTSSIFDRHAHDKEHGIQDTMMYRTMTLTSWDCFKIRYGTVWVTPELWRMMLNLGGAAMLVLVLTVLLVHDPAAMKVAKFTELSKFLNVVVGLLLGFFLSSSVTRWYSCVNGYLELLDAIRNIQMQFVALGVPEKEAVTVIRYGFASAWLLYGQLLIEAQELKTCNGSDDAVTAQREKMWDKLTSKHARIDRTNHTKLLLPHEAEILKLTRDPPGMMWMWVAALIGRLAQDGWVPPMASPTYGRIMNLCQSAHAGIRQVRCAISVQAPLTYTHMLATLVHINNLINAVTFGVVSGLAIGTALSRDHAGQTYYEGHKASAVEVAQDWQNMAVTFLYCFFGPLIYQALLLISMHLAQPFESEDARMPFDRLLHQLEIDLCNGRDLVDHMDIERPAFKKQ